MQVACSHSRYLLLFVALLLFPRDSARAAVSIPGAAGLQVTVDPSGSYDIALSNPAWDFGGDLGYPLSNLTVTSGADGAGSYSEIGFDFEADAPRHGAIRSYWNKRAVLFTLSNSAPAANTLAFPNLTRYPRNLGHVSFCGMFAAPNFYAFAEESPWVLFDTAANAFVISPASNFMAATTVFGPGGALASGISSRIASLPAGFSHQVLLVVENGINSAFDAWGSTLTAIWGRALPANDADPTLNQLGYWTDAGSSYYYNTLPSSSYTDTLMAVKADFDKLGLGLGYLQLDSWFYPKGPGADWLAGSDGIYQYLAAPSLFPSGLDRFQRTLGAALVTHSRWIDASSPYRQQYAISGNVSTDPAYWDSVARYLAHAGVTTYEQDWLSGNAQTNFDLTAPGAFLDNMAAAMAREHITLMYSMPTPRHFLQGARYGNLTSIRVSQDRFERARWTSFLYAGRLASALGIWPFSDVFMSGETANLLLATLSAGPVGVGDAAGSLDGASLRRAVRADGVIVKPDVPLAPLDVNYLGDVNSSNRPLIASTYSDFGGRGTHYVFAYNRASDTRVTFSLSDLGIGQQAYLYNYAAGTGQLVSPDTALSADFQDGWVYLVAAPVGPSGMAILGDTGHFVTMGKKRVTAFEDDGTVRVTVAFAPGEASRTLTGYSPSAPTASARSGSIGAVVWDPDSRRFSVTVTPGADGSATVQLARPQDVAPVRNPAPIQSPGGSGLALPSTSIAP
jgi:hypothetical protein